MSYVVSTRKPLFSCPLEQHRETKCGDFLKYLTETNNQAIISSYFSVLESISGTFQFPGLVYSY